VGYETSDDAGVYRLNDETAIITTADIITPPVNDPYLFGQIAAANAISDVYAMGGRPLTCINLVAFPSRKLEPGILHQIVAGALNKITEAGAVLAGGHSIDDDEPKFGLAVTGIVHPKKYWSNQGARAGDVLILTKPLGSGVIFNANLKNWVSRSALDECITTISALNKSAMEVLLGFGVHAVTDVTGFGLAGHCLEMVKNSDVRLEIKLDDLPVMREALDMYKKGMTTGVNPLNQQMVAEYLSFERTVPGWHQEIVYDPQTSGGLLVAVPQDQGGRVLESLKNAGMFQARIIGQVCPRQDSVCLVFG
jgi:selenide,water dikinase